MLDAQRSSASQFSFLEPPTKKKSRPEFIEENVKFQSLALYCQTKLAEINAADLRLPNPTHTLVSCHILDQIVASCKPLQPSLALIKESLIKSIYSDMYTSCSDSQRKSTLKDMGIDAQLEPIPYFDVVERLKREKEDVEDKLVVKNTEIQELDDRCRVLEDENENCREFLDICKQKMKELLATNKQLQKEKLDTQKALSLTKDELNHANANIETLHIELLKAQVASGD